MRRDLLVNAVDVLFFVGFLAGSGGGARASGGILRLFCRHGREVEREGRKRDDAFTFSKWSCDVVNPGRE